jgi:hypothetical protein
MHIEAQMLDVISSDRLTDTVSSAYPTTKIYPLRNGSYAAVFTSRDFEAYNGSSYATSELVKFGKNGSLMWNVTFGEEIPAAIEGVPSNTGTLESILNVMELEGGNLLVFRGVGYHRFRDTVFVSCVDTNGKKLWIKKIPVYTTIIKQTGNTIDVLAKEKNSIFRYDTALILLKKIKVCPDTTVITGNFVKLPDGGYFFKGIKPGIDAYHDLEVLWNIDAQSELRWMKTIGDRYTYHIYDITVDDEGALYYTLFDSVETHKDYLFKLNNSGNIIWQSPFYYKLNDSENNYFHGFMNKQLIVANITHQYKGPLHTLGAINSIVHLGIFNISTGEKRSSHWIIAPAYAATIDMLWGHENEIVGLITGPILGNDCRGVFVKFDWNDPPRIISRPDDFQKALEENRVYHFQINVQDIFPNDRLTFSIKKSDVSSCSIESSSGSGLLAINPEKESDVGNKIVELYCTDRMGQKDSLLLNFEVSPSNDAPTAELLRYYFEKTPDSKIVKVKLLIAISDPESDSIKKTLFNGDYASLERNLDTCIFYYNDTSISIDTITMQLADIYDSLSNYTIRVNLKQKWASLNLTMPVVKARNNSNFYNAYRSQILHANDNKKRIYDIQGKLLSQKNSAHGLYLIKIPDSKILQKKITMKK